MTNDDDNQNYALAVVAGVVALVIALVIGLAAWSSSENTGPAAATASTAAAAPAGTETFVIAERIYFETGSATLPAEAAEVLIRVSESARAKTDANVLISGFHDATGSAANNEELAKQRALAVRHGLEANGVDPAHLIMDKPAVTTGGADEREARRVELKLQ